MKEWTLFVLKMQCVLVAMNGLYMLSERQWGLACANVFAFPLLMIVRNYVKKGQP